MLFEREGFMKGYKNVFKNLYFEKIAQTLKENMCVKSRNKLKEKR